MPSALAYGLMGAASGFLGGLKQQNDEDQRTAETRALLQARAMEQQQLAAMTHQYHSDENVQKAQLDFESGSEMQKQKAGDALTLSAQQNTQNMARDTANNQVKASLTASENATRLAAANISANAPAKDKAPTPLGDALYQNKDGSYVMVKSGQTPPANSTPIQSGSSFGQPAFVMPGGLLGNFGAPAPGAAPAAPATPAAPAKTIINTGTVNGRKVNKYSDGTVDYAD